MAQVSPMGDEEPKVVTKRQSFLGLGKKIKPNVVPPIRLTSLNLEKFDLALSPDFTSGFEESEDCFTEITCKAASLLGAEKCFIFIKDTKEQKLYTFKNRILLQQEKALNKTKANPTPLPKSIYNISNSPAFKASGIMKITNYRVATLTI